jgi:ABC-type transporter Mla subunit MlaD
MRLAVVLAVLAALPAAAQQPPAGFPDCGPRAQELTGVVTQRSARLREITPRLQQFVGQPAAARSAEAQGLLREACSLSEEIAGAYAQLAEWVSGPSCPPPTPQQREQLTQITQTLRTTANQTCGR